MELRLFVFHHAGGSHLTYRDWPSRFPADWQVRLLDAPGRGMLADLPAIGDAQDLVTWFHSELEGQLDAPFALFGHSMGALIAYELTRLLHAEGRPPCWLGLSARSAPHSAPRRSGTGRHLLSDQALRDELAAMGGTPADVLDDPELWEIFSPVIRGDLRLVDTWRPRPQTAPLPVPLSVYGGTHDALAPPRHLREWATYSTRHLGVRLFHGGHFYFRPDATELTTHIAGDIRTALALPTPAPRS
ncbi:thioesterase II family protein [Streptomyces sp. NPDC004830]